MTLETHVATNALHEELAHQLSALGGVRRELGRIGPAGCSAGCAAVLTLLDRHGTMSIGRLTELLGITISGTSRYIAHLAALGWVDRRPDPADRRSRVLRLTPKGRARSAEVSDHRSRELAARLGGWSDEDVRRLVGLLSRLRDDFEDPWTEPTGEHTYAEPTECSHGADAPPHHTHRIS